MRPSLMFASFLAAIVPAVAQPPAPRVPSKAAPTVDQILSLERVGAPQISPDARWVAYTVRRANWDDNAYDTQIWLADVRSGTSRALTNSKKSSSAPAWSPDGSRLAFASDRTDKRQIYVIHPSAGEAQPLTSLDDWTGSFAWSPDGARIAYTATEPKPADLKEREQKYGEFRVIDQEHRMTDLFVIDVATGATHQLTHGTRVVGSFDWSPDGRAIAFDHRVNADPASSATADISIVTVADGTIRKLVAREGADTRPVWSPDGSRIAFQTPDVPGAPSFANHNIAVIPAGGGAIELLTASFDENPSIESWNGAGLFFSASQRTRSYLYRVDPASKSIAKLAPIHDEDWVGSSFSFSRDGTAVACLGSDSSSIAELYVATLSANRSTGSRDLASGFSRTLKKLTDMNAQTAGWTTSALEVIAWKSQDDTPIEGVLHKPLDFDARRRYPLLVVIHGGPTGVSRAVPFTSTTYPIDVWVPRGALVLEPNYRGSAAYGEKFRALNVGNLGIGDAWDVLSGVDALIEKGMVDPARVAVMGWSQGGYISAFLATHDSARFKAISVGAGISDWMTYYVSTDIHPFTRQYLKATPWDDPEIYARTSPITYIKQAKTPTLIQHGDADQRVPPPNAFELYQGLQDQQVPAKLIIYKGFGGIGHGPSKPKSNRAVMEHNLEWFDRYLFDTTPGPTRQ